MATDWQALWDELNQRQRTFLQVLYDREREREAVYCRRDMMFHPLRKCGAWRWVDHQGDLCDRLFHGHGISDPGEGSTWASLQSRGYVERRWRRVIALGAEFVILSVRLTTKGRRLVRTLAAVSAS